MRTRYVVLAMLVLLSIITYLDRICIAVAGPEMQKDLKISDEHWGWVLTAFLLGYGIFEIPSGALGDRIGQRKVLTRIVVWWSAFTTLTAVATNYYALVATRFLFGAGEAGAYPNASGCIGRWFPVEERARAQGLVWGASRLGGALTPLLVYALQVLPARIAAWVHESVGVDVSKAAAVASQWQTPFFVFGSLGLVWAAVWYFWFRDDPATHSWVQPQELVEIGNPSASTAHHHGVPWAKLFASPQLWLIVAMYWFYVFGFIFFMFWLPKYLRDGRQLSAGETTVCVSLMFAMGALGNVIGGWASDLLSRRYGLAIGRKVIGVTCLTLSGLLVMSAALSPNKWIAAAILILCFGITDGMLPCSWAICLDVGKKYAGAVSGAMNTAGQAAGAISTVLFGYALTWFGGDYDWPLLLLAPSLLISAVLFALIDPTQPIVPDPQPQPGPNLVPESSR